MNRRRNDDEYAFIAIKVLQNEASAGAEININLRVSNNPYPSEQEPVFTSSSRLELLGTAIWPEDRVDDRYEITVSGKKDGEKPSILKELRALDTDGHPIYTKRHGSDVPVYNVPPGIGMIERRRGTRLWNCWVHVPARAVSDMLRLVCSRRALYVSIHERKIDRHRWIVGFALQTNNPADD